NTSQSSPTPSPCSANAPKESAMKPFERMYESFRLFSVSAQERGKLPYYQLSAGANWIPAGSAVLRCLHEELDSALTYRNYGRSAGPLGVTDALEDVEARLGDSATRPAVTI